MLSCRMYKSSKKKHLVIFSSGEGSNLEAIINYFRSHLVISIACIISDKNSKSLKRGANHSIPTLYLPSINHSRETYDKLLTKHVNLYSPNLIVLSGFMRILSPSFISRYPNKIVNIHPSLLPKYKGLRTHKRVFENKEKFHGTTIHYVEDKLDSGKIIAQHVIVVSDQDTEDSLRKKVKHLEQQVYSKTIESILL